MPEHQTNNKMKNFIEQCRSIYIGIRHKRENRGISERLSGTDFVLKEMDFISYRAWPRLEAHAQTENMGVEANVRKFDS